MGHSCLMGGFHFLFYRILQEQRRFVINKFGEEDNVCAASVLTDLVAKEWKVLSWVIIKIGDEVGRVY